MSVLPREFADCITVPDAAAEAGIGQEAVRNAIYRGKLKVAAQFFGRKLIRRSDFDAWRAATKMGRPFKNKSAEA